MMVRSLRLLALMSLLPVMVFSATAQQATQPLFLTFIPNIQFSPLYVAIENGYFAEAGQPIRVEYVTEPDAIDLVASGQANYAVVSAEQVMLAGVNGRPITYVYNWFHDYPIAVVANADAGIAQVVDLQGRTVGVPMRSGATYTGLVALLTANDMSENDIDLQEIGFNAPEAFCTGRVEAAVVYVNNEPLQIQRLIDENQCRGVSAITVLRVSDALPMVSNGLIVNNDFLRGNRDQVASFVDAFHRGLMDTIRNPARAYLLSVPHVENLPLSEALRAVLEEEAAAQEEFLRKQPDAEAIAASREALIARLREAFTPEELLQMEVLLATIALWDTAAPGMTDVTAWDNMAEVLTALGLIEADGADLDALYTNEFVPEPVVAPGS